MKIEMTVEQAELVMMAIQTEKVQVKAAYAETLPEEKVLRKRMNNIITNLTAIETMIELDIKAHGNV